MEHNDSLHQHHHHDLHPATGDEEALIDAAMDAADTKHEELDHDEHHHLLEPLPFEPVDEIHQDNHRRRDNHDNHQESHSPVEGDILESNKKDRSIEKPPPTSTKDPALVEEPTMWDVLSGRGASVNAHVGNKRFRSLCFSRKAEFEAANLAAKKRIAVEIVQTMISRDHTRFLKQTKQGWLRLPTEQAIHKAAQVMRDFHRPDRVLRGIQCTKRNKTTATPNAPHEIKVLPPINEIPEGLRQQDVLSGRGAFVNEYPGNQHLRTLATARHEQFRTGNYVEKRKIALEIVNEIKSSDPPGRFLKKPDAKDESGPLIAEEWLQMSDEKAIAKTCQVLRDMKRPDRWERDEKRKLKKRRQQELRTSQERYQASFTTESIVTKASNHEGMSAILHEMYADSRDEDVPMMQNYDGPEHYNHDEEEEEEELHPDIVAEAVAAAMNKIDKPPAPPDSSP